MSLISRRKKKKIPPKKKKEWLGLNSLLPIVPH
jgi:hypothetical protein